mmetsp:Transcript_99589/g.253120  ORF Transcript_99589/g.253120 Transcript_99589/m.253120 type:complete len:286 (-) Transcript_99589:388-1245(-)
MRIPLDLPDQNGRIDQMLKFLSRDGAGLVFVNGEEQFVQGFRDHRPPELLPGLVFLHHLLSDGDHVLRHHASHDGEQRPSRVNIEDDEHGLQDGHRPKEGHEFQKIPRGECTEKREHAVLDRSEHGDDLFQVLVLMDVLRQHIAIADQPCAQDGNDVEGHDEEHQNPKHAMKSLQDALCQFVEWPDNAYQPEETNDPQESQHPHQQEGNTHFPFVGGRMAAGDSSDLVSQGDEPLIYDPAGHNGKIKHVPDPILLVLEELATMPRYANHELERKKREQHLLEVEP